MSEQTLTDFYAGCDGGHREFFSVLIHEWEALGLPWQWQGQYLDMGFRSVTHDEMSVFFQLRSGVGVDEAMIILDHSVWSRRLGIEEAERFFRSITTKPGLKHERQNEQLRLLSPGHLSGPLQSELRGMIRKFAYRLPDLVAA